MHSIQFNTSNAFKQKELAALFASHHIHVHFTHVDIKEIQASHLEVVVHKASQLPPATFVEDVSFDVENHNIGIAIKHNIHRLDALAGHNATATVLMAYHHPFDAKIYVYKGSVSGLIIKKGSDHNNILPAHDLPGLGPFDPYFQPHGQQVSLAHHKPNHYNARAIAIEHWIKKQPFSIQPLLKNWQGPWQ